MQMYLFGKVPAFGLGGIPSANGGDDAEVVYHEYTHGLSNRLVIYPDGNSGLDNQQAGSMGEAWSDWYAEDFLNQQGYKPDTGAVGDVVMGELTFNSLLRTQPVDCPVGTVDPALPGRVRHRTRWLHLRRLRPHPHVRRRQRFAGGALGR